MARKLELISPNGEIQTFELGAESTLINAASGYTYRLTGVDGAKKLWVIRDGDNLVVAGLPDGSELVLTNFYVACTAVDVCTLLLSEPGNPTNQAITPATQAVAALSGDRFLMFSATGVSEESAAPLVEKEDSSIGTWLAAGGAVALGGLALAGGGGGGSGSNDVSSSPETPQTDPQPNPTPTPTPTPTPAPDNEAPALLISSDAPATGPADGPVVYQFLFSEYVTGFTARDIAVQGGTLSNFDGSGALYSATVTPPDGETGTIRLGVAANAAIDADRAGNSAAAAEPVAFDRSDVTTPPPPTPVVDTDRPDLDITDDTAGIANGPVIFTFTFTEPVTGFTTDDVSVNSSRGLADIGTLQALSTSVYQLSITPPDDLVGVLTVSVGNNQVQDSAGNGNIASVQVQPFSPTLPAGNQVQVSTASLLDTADATNLYPSSSEPAQATASRYGDANYASAPDLTANTLTTTEAQNLLI